MQNLVAVKVIGAVAALVAAYGVWLLFYGFAMFSYLNPPSSSIQISRWLGGFPILLFVPMLAKKDGRFDFFLEVFFLALWCMSLFFCIGFLPLTIIGQEHFGTENKRYESLTFFLLPLLAIYYAQRRVGRYKQERST